MDKADVNPGRKRIPGPLDFNCMWFGWYVPSFWKNGFPPFLDRGVGCVREGYGHREKSGEWRKLHNEELTDLYFSLNIIQAIKSRGTNRADDVVLTGDGRCAYRVLVEKHESKSQLERHRRRWEDNIEMDLQEVGLGALTGLVWLVIGTDGWVL